MEAIPCGSLSEFEERIRATVDPVSLPSLAYGITQRGEDLAVGAFGIANKETSTPATPATPYSLASVTKPMTATAIMLLAERGLVRLDAPINDYLGEAKLEAKVGDALEATVSRVADHTAGLPLHFQFYYADEPYVRPPMDETIRRYGKLFTPPGERYYYSNLGYGLLDCLIERQTGRTYAEFMQEEIFAPLGMSTASIGSTPKAAIPYGPDGVGYPDYDFDHPGGSAAFASARDLLAFGHAHLGYGPQLFSRDRILEMQRRTAIIDEFSGYGLGWSIHENRLGFRLVRHTGSMGGVTTFLRLVPELDLVIAVVANGQGDLSTLGDEAIAAVSPEFRSRLAEERAHPEPPVASQMPPAEVSGDWHGFFETYQERLPLDMRVTPDRNPVLTLNGTPAEIGNVQIRNSRFLGIVDGDLRTPDTARCPYRIHLDLALRDGQLNGAAVAITHVEGRGGGTPGQRLGNALASWFEATKG